MGHPVHGRSASFESSLLEESVAIAEPAALTTPKGRSVEVWDAGDADRIVVRSPSGALILSIEVTDAGPRLSFQSAEVELHGTRALRLRSPEIEVAADRDLKISAGANIVSEAGRHHEMYAAAELRMEARAVELQASERHIEVRAAGRIAIDGEHIGLNDNPHPTPFGWTRYVDDE